MRLWPSEVWETFIDKIRPMFSLRQSHRKQVCACQTEGAQCGITLSCVKAAVYGSICSALALCPLTMLDLQKCTTMWACGPFLLQALSLPKNHKSRWVRALQLINLISDWNLLCWTSGDFRARRTLAIVLCFPTYWRSQETGAGGLES